MKKEFKNWILDINNINADEMDNLLLAININCTSDLIDFLITE